MNNNTANVHISDLSFAKEKIIKDLKENKKRRLSALFRDLRKMDSILGIGDWSVMSIIVQQASKFRKLSQYEVWTLCKQSKEYKGMLYGEKQRFSKSLWQSIDY